MKIHYGLIASGNQVIKDAALRDRLNKDLGGDVLCIEMGAAGLMNTFPCLMIRGICDYADSHKNQDWQEHAAAAAAAFAKELIGYVQPSDVEKEVLGAISETHADVEVIKAGLHNQKTRKILNWLTAVGYGLQQSDYLAKRQPRTGDWFLSSPEFQTWSNCDSLKPPGIPESVKNIYNKYEHVGMRPSLDDLLKVLLEISTVYSKVFIIIDGLDECQTTEDCRSKFQSAVFELQSKIGAKCFATSRPTPSITDLFAFEGCLNLPIRATKNDIWKYLDSRLPLIEGVVRRDPEVQDEVKQTIIQSADGMFLLAKLWVDSLVNLDSLRKVRAVLKSHQTNTNPYNLMYRQILERVKAQGGRTAERAMKLLSWVICAHTPLTTIELQHALAVDSTPGNLEIIEEGLLEINYIVSTCGGLVTIDEESDIVRLVHYTAHEYYVKAWGTWFPSADADIPRTCVICLNYDDLDSSVQMIDPYNPAAVLPGLTPNPLYEYAVCYWGFHAKGSIESEELVLRFLRSKKRAPSSKKQYKIGRGNGYFDPNLAVGIHLAAYFGLNESIRILLQEAKPSQNSWRSSLLGKILGDSELDAKDYYSQTPLMWAAYYGRLSTVRLLLDEGAKVNAQSYPRKTALYAAAERGNHKVAKLLLERGAKATTYDEHSFTPLHIATENGHHEVVEVLLDGGAKLEAKDMYRNAPILRAACWGYYKVVKLLLDRGADVKPQGDFTSRMLTVQATSGHYDVMRLLLDKGAKVEVRVPDMFTFAMGVEETPPCKAVQDWHGKVV
ncbi:Ankyrin-1 [Dactylellina cionopaga]|nr:Ankyrin-1 [Dactylellina cionopaga]